MNGLFYRRDIGVDLSKAYVRKMAGKKNVIQVKLRLWYLRKHANVDVDGVMNYSYTPVHWPRSHKEPLSDKGEMI